MMNLLQGASDDQVALIGCFVALAGSMALMYVSFFVGPASRKKSQDAASATRQLPMRPSIGIPTETTRDRAA
jgi:hypothetical protein